jgi:hypothetical protein
VINQEDSPVWVSEMVALRYAATATASGNQYCGSMAFWDQERIRKTDLRIWIRNLLFSSVADKHPTKNKFLFNIFLLIIF